MIIYGKQVVLYILQNFPQMIEEVILSKEIDQKLFNRFRKLNVPVIKADNKKAQALCRGGNHQGFLLRLKEYSFAQLSDVKNLSYLVVLDGLSDVGNIGAICRSAYALGAGALIVSNVKSLNIEGIVRTSSGAALSLPIVHFANIADIVNELKQAGYSLIGADINGKELKSFSHAEQKKLALFLGSEGEGLSGKVLKKLDHKVSIKMSNSFDSLNVSVAAGILMHELFSGE